jgi:hypothetical protein
VNAACSTPQVADVDDWTSLQAAELQQQLQLRDLVISRLVPQAEADRVCGQMWLLSCAPLLCSSYAPALCDKQHTHQEYPDGRCCSCRSSSRRRGTRTVAAGACWSLQMCRGWSQAWTLLASSLLTLRRPEHLKLRCWQHHHGSCGRPNLNWGPQVGAHSMRTMFLAGSPFASRFLLEARMLSAGVLRCDGLPQCRRSILL